jgi:hypothetical protein
MSVTWFDWEIQEEGTTPKTRYRPAPTRNRFGATVKLGKNGAAEIKPHHWLGICKGVEQLHNSTVTGPRVLITYRPLNSRNGIATTGRPACVQMFMTYYVKPTTPGARPLTPGAVLKGQWWLLGSIVPPPTVPLTIDNPGLFGAGVEDVIRQHFDKHVLKPRDHNALPGTGGSGTGHDVLWEWQELAGMYAELGNALRDPFYAELAVALAGPRR